MIDDADLTVHAVDHVDELLRRVGREDEIVNRTVAERRLLENILGDEGAVLAEDLQAVIRSIANIDQAVPADADAVHGIAKLARRRLRGIVARLFLVARPFTVG